MSSEKSKKIFQNWDPKLTQSDLDLGEEFTREVVSRAHNKVIVKEILLMIVQGFWSIILGFLKTNFRPISEENNREIKDQ